MNSREALTTDQQSLLEREGYLVLPGILPADFTAELTRFLNAEVERRLAEMLREAEAKGSMNWGAEFGVMGFDLEPADPKFAACTRHPLLWSAAVHVLGPQPELRKVCCRIPFPGSGHQGLHSDLGPATPGHWKGIQATWCIGAHTADNGATRIIPGSHLSAEPPMDLNEFGCAMKPHPKEVRLLGEPGTLIIFNAQAYHAGMFNYSSGPRLGIALRLYRAG